MDTFKVIETLVFHIPEMRKIFTALQIVSVQNIISPNNHDYYASILESSGFIKNGGLKGLYAISIFGSINVTLIIRPNERSVNRGGRGLKHHVIKIVGYRTEILDLSKTGILNTLQMYIKNRLDYLPDAFIRKIVYINCENGDNALFSEISNGKWTLGDPYDLNNPGFECTHGEIFTNILNDTLNIV